MNFLLIKQGIDSTPSEKKNSQMILVKKLIIS